jgi:hypothetical protein
LLAEDLRKYRLHTVPGEFGSYSHRLRCWTAGVARGNDCQRCSDRRARQ